MKDCILVIQATKYIFGNIFGWYGASTMVEFGDDSSGGGLQLSSSLSFIEDELGSGASPGDVDLGGEDQPFDILQKSLLEADITEQTLAQEALLDSQPTPTLVQAPVPFSSQVVSGGYGGGAVNTSTASLPAGQFVQGMSTLPNGSAQHIQVLGSFGTTGGVMTLGSLERNPQIVLRPGVSVAPAGNVTGGHMFTPTQGPVGLPFKNIPLQNIIIQRGPGGTQTLVRPIQPKPLQTGAQTVYSLGLQTSSTTTTNTAAVPGGQYTANGSIVVQSPLDQQQTQVQTSVSPGDFLLPTSITLKPSSAVHNGPATPTSSAVLGSQNPVHIVAGQNFTASVGSQLILNQGLVSASQVGGAVTQTWTSVSSTSPAPMQTSCAAARLTLVGPATAGLGGQSQVSASPVQRLLVTQTQNCTSLSPLPGNINQEQDYRQVDPYISRYFWPFFIVTHVSFLCNLSKFILFADLMQVSALKRPVPLPLTRAEMILEQVRNDHIGVQTTNRHRFTSIDDALLRLLPYHVFQGTPPSPDEFSQVDEDFEAVASHVLQRTQSMVNKYRRLLMVEAERSSPSSEMVMIDRTFNQEERGNLTQDKRMVLVDPDGFLEDFCCGMKSKHFQPPSPPQPLSNCSWTQSEPGSAQSPYKSDFQPGYEDPGGGGTTGRGEDAEDGSALELKRQEAGNLKAGNGCPRGKPSAFAAKIAAQTLHQQPSSHAEQHQYSPPRTDSDSALEAAVNSILEC
uniref:GLTSCR protein conserved domain-containing protein n=1 Tax=Gouania willdenowi TaxID=441366 RepID=A0A8C5DG11_GOUWI